MEKITLLKSKYTHFMPMDYYLEHYDALDNFVIIEVLTNEELPVVVNCVHRSEWEDFIEEQKENLITGENLHQEQEEKELQEACSIVLKTDPFGGKYSGYKLIEIFEQNLLWVDKAIKEMKNKYIVEKLKLIQKGLEDGKISI